MKSFVRLAREFGWGRVHFPSLAKPARPAWGAALEMRHRCKPIGGSNPSLSPQVRSHGYQRMRIDGVERDKPVGILSRPEVDEGRRTREAGAA
jgi:hypothetical protein